jgi:hypothetical protein
MGRLEVAQNRVDWADFGISGVEPSGSATRVS